MARSAKRTRQSTPSSPKKKAKTSLTTQDQPSLRSTHLPSNTQSDSVAVVDPDWSDGNFKVTTADGVVFMVHDYVLLSASPVFVDLRSLFVTQPGLPRTRSQTAPLFSEMEFVDPDIETASVFRWFMSIATTLKVTFTLLNCRHLGPLFLFMRKWDTQSLFNLVRGELLSFITQGILPPLKVFDIGALLDDVEICKAVLRSAASSHHDHD